MFGLLVFLFILMCPASNLLLYHILVPLHNDLFFVLLSFRQQFLVLGLFTLICNGLKNIQPLWLLFLGFFSLAGVFVNASEFSFNCHHFVKLSMQFYQVWVRSVLAAYSWPESRSHLFKRLCNAFFFDFKTFVFNFEKLQLLSNSLFTSQAIKLGPFIDGLEYTIQVSRVLFNLPSWASWLFAIRSSGRLSLTNTSGTITRHFLWRTPAVAPNSDFLIPSSRYLD